MPISDPTDERVIATVDELVLANKILTVESVFDAYGHVSVRHPNRTDRFLMSLDSPPILVSAVQVAEYDLEGELAPGQSGPSYFERYIHAAIYAARPDVNAICHNHTLDVLPFCAVPAVQLQIISHTASVLEAVPPVWDIVEDFGPDTNLMVTDMQRGNSMCKSLGAGAAVLMRSHGSTVVGRDIRHMVVRTHELIRNARALIDARSLGAEVLVVGDSEIALNTALSAGGSFDRQWRYFCWRVAHHGLQGGTEPSNSGSRCEPAGCRRVKGC